eukprot:757591-Hanusia_phi.AAC.1
MNRSMNSELRGCNSHADGHRLCTKTLLAKTHPYPSLELQQPLRQLGVVFLGRYRTRVVAKVADRGGGGVKIPVRGALWQGNIRG